MAFDVKDYRQPMINSSGFIMAFLLGFLGQWITEPNFALRSASDYVTFTGTALGLLLLLGVQMGLMLPSEETGDGGKGHYLKLLRLYVVGVVVPVVALLVAAFL